MTIRFHCPNDLCLKRLKAPDEFAGRPSRCTRCKTRFTVPTAPVLAEVAGEHPWFSELAPISARTLERARHRVPALARVEAGPTPPPLPFFVPADPPPLPRSRLRKPDKQAIEDPPTEADKLESQFRSNARWAGGSAFVLGAIALFVAIGSSAADDQDFPRGASVLLGLVGATFTGLGALTWSRRVLAAKFLAGVFGVWICCQIVGLIYLIGFTSHSGATPAGPGLGFLLSSWLIQVCGKAIDAAGRLRKVHGRTPTPGRFPWVGTGLTAASLLAVGVLTLLRASPIDWSKIETTSAPSRRADNGSIGTEERVPSAPRTEVSPPARARSNEPTKSAESTPAPVPTTPKTSESPSKIDPPVVNAGPKKPVRLSDLKIEKTKMDPPSVTFTVRLDLGGADLLETWASVDIADPGEVLKIFAGALYQGLLSFTIDGMTVDFANPPPSLKAQRVRLKKSDSDPNVYVGEVKFPKVKAPETTTFGVLLAARSGGQVVQSNAVTCRVNLKTGKVQP